MCCSVSPATLPRGKEKKKKTQPDPEVEAPEVETEENNLQNPNIEEYLPKPQTEWFHMVIQAQVKKVIQQSLAEQKREFTEQLDQFKQSMKRELDEIQENIKTIKELEKRERFKLEEIFHKKFKKVEELRLNVDVMEQGQHKSSIQIVGLPESEDDTKALIKLSKEKLGVKLKAADIGYVTRLGKQQKSEKPRNVVVEFKSETTRNEIYKKRKKLMTNKDPKRNIYVNDRLTDHRQNLLYSARKLVKSHKIFAAWSQSGNVLVRKTEKAKIMHVHNHEDLRNILDDEVDSNQIDENTSSTLTHLSGYSYQYDSDIM